ncbi:MAG: hypothetical protein HN975_10605 [Anaerolineae bacterium]|jgi:hypothetical protein|nr:hypothetical protein [Anaerolineae bacterium]
MSGLITKLRFTSFECVYCKETPGAYIASAFPPPSKTCTHEKLKCLICDEIFETFGEAFIHTIKENITLTSISEPINHQKQIFGSRAR